jgi:hypothetical protein
MASHSAISIPKPKNWQDFERHSKVLFECILKDPHTQLNGRSGQPQHGVDIFGCRDGSGPWIGIQCKGKSAGYGKSVDEKELRAEVLKAKGFRPRIREFFLVTTAPNDERIQEVARRITMEGQSSGRTFIVSVWGWDTLELEISQHDKALRAFHLGE